MAACVEHHRVVHPCECTGNNGVVVLHRARDRALAQRLTIGNRRRAQRALLNGGNALSSDGVSTVNKGNNVIFTQRQRTLRDGVGIHNVFVRRSSQRTGEGIISKQPRRTGIGQCLQLLAHAGALVVRCDGDSCLFNLHFHTLRNRIVVVLITHHLIVHGVGLSILAGGNNIAVIRTIQAVLHCAALGCACGNKRLLTAVVGQFIDCRSYADFGIDLFDLECRAATDGIVAALLIRNDYRCGSGIGVVLVGNLVLTRRNLGLAILDGDSRLNSFAGVGEAADQLNRRICHGLWCNRPACRCRAGIIALAVDGHSIIARIGLSLDGHAVISGIQHCIAQLHTGDSRRLRRGIVLKAVPVQCHCCTLNALRINSNFYLVGDQRIVCDVFRREYP